MKKLRAGIIGTGGIAGVHLSNIKLIDSVELVCGCDIKEDILNRRAKEFNFKPYTFYEEMLNKEKLDFVLLCTHQTVRKEPIAFCAEKGIPVFTEKPPASDSKTAGEIEKIIKSKNLTVSVGFVFRYLKIVTKAIELLHGRKILLLQLQYLCGMMYPESRSKDIFYRKEISGGLIGDQAIHMLDLCRYILQDEIKEIQVFGANVMQPKTKDITTEESVVINMRSQKDSLISYLHTWTHRGFEATVEIFASDAKLLLGLFSGKLTGVIDGVEISYSPEESPSLHFSELYEFVKHLENGKGKILSTYSDSIKTMEVVEGAMKSIDNNKIVKL